MKRSIKMCLAAVIGLVGLSTPSFAQSLGGSRFVPNPNQSGGMPIVPRAAMPDRTGTTPTGDGTVAQPNRLIRVAESIPGTARPTSTSASRTERPRTDADRTQSPTSSSTTQERSSNRLLCGFRNPDNEESSTTGESAVVARRESGTSGPTAGIRQPR